MHLANGSQTQGPHGDTKQELQLFLPGYQIHLC
jgi:hypothetical protein